MSTIKSIRERLGVTQAALAEGMGCTQANISFYENGQTVPPERAEALIAYALTLGKKLTFNDIYASSEPPIEPYYGPERRGQNQPPMANPHLDRRLKEGV